MKLNPWQNLKIFLSAAYSLSKDSQTPRLSKFLLATALVYTTSPIDLIPDFIPILGQLDDLLIVPLLLWLAFRIIPQPLWQEHLESAKKSLNA